MGIGMVVGAERGIGGRFSGLVVAGKWHFRRAPVWLGKFESGVSVSHGIDGGQLVTAATLLWACLLQLSADFKGLILRNLKVRRFLESRIE